ncbi:hypothetical protein CEUSTIGMA_g12311.t1 [Chlamydomonas eustigma]|uniref:GST N-terminal domain-containing protein n=1 Tax=Chlamydomonas eustigma TaxID=1157962 RepID=A0A250XQ10_9CHLO|nr:hypothetical protein CEUSTIGMA_g12311.t1 [Chlamydomonas eustigma]|eukprot:GAX84890.1 hypothetical protein CEUSTIGMA_g12311.t1 [Chlamydomonas eustigma]
MITTFVKLPACTPRSISSVRAVRMSDVRSRKISAQAIKLYTNPGSRGKIPEWVLSELNLPYETVLLDMRSGEHKAPKYLEINPFGKVPAMEDGDLKLFESGGILLHLASKYGQLPQDQLSKAFQWTLFANSTLSPALFEKQAQMPQMLLPLDKILAMTKYLEGSEFSVSDIAVGSYLLYLPLFFPDLFSSGGFIDKYPNVWRYMKEIVERPSCPDAYKEGMISAVQASSSKNSGGNPLSNLFKK